MVPTMKPLELVILSWTLIVTMVSGVSFDTNGEQYQCLGQLVEYQCIVTGSVTNILTWTVYNENGTQIGSPHHYLSTSIGGSISIGGVFTVEQIPPMSPLVSNISFTVQSSINGYTISCEDGNTMDNENFTINILAVIAPPTNISFISSDSSVNSVSWMPSSSECISSYSITSNTTNSIITTTDTSVDIPLAGLSPGVYCVSVATVDTANRTGEYSNQECVSLKVPLAPDYSYDLSAAESMDNAIVTVSLTFNLTSNVPVVTAGYIVIGSQEFKGNPTEISNNQIHVELQLTLKQGVNYSIMCFGENILGNGSLVAFNIYVNHSEVLSTPSIPTSSTNNVSISNSISTSSISVTELPSTSSLTPPLSGNNDLNVYNVVVPIVVIIIIIVVIVISILVIYIMLKRFKVKPSKSSNEQTDEKNIDLVNITTTKNESSESTPSVEDKLHQSTSESYKPQDSTSLHANDKNSNWTSLDPQNDIESTNEVTFGPATSEIFSGSGFRM